jgi:hypothetical protein
VDSASIVYLLSVAGGFPPVVLIVVRRIEGRIHLRPYFVAASRIRLQLSLDVCITAERSDVSDISLPPIPGVPDDKMASGRAQRDQVVWMCG